MDDRDIAQRFERYYQCMKDAARARGEKSLTQMRV